MSDMPPGNTEHQDGTNGDIIAEAAAKAADEILNGKRGTEIVDSLRRMGLDRQTAALTYLRVRTAIRQTQKQSAKTCIIAGGWWMAASLIAIVVLRVIYPVCAWLEIAVYGVGLLGLGLAQLTVGIIRWRRASRF